MVLLIATAGLVYELGMAAVASYLLGDTVNQFSLVIGTYLSAMGAGAYLSRFVGDRLALAFIDVELATALIGGLSAPGLFLAFGYVSAFELVLYLTVGAVGVLVGLELPLLIRVLEYRLELKELIARALTFDYAGALLGSLGFSFLLVPYLGLIRGSIACGLMNAMVGLWATFALADAQGVPPRAIGRARARALFVLAALALAWVQAEPIGKVSDAALHPGKLVVAEQSAHQRIVLAETARDLRLYLNGHLQFSSRDERRYHEALVHPALTLAQRRRHVLIGGGGDGLAAREVLRWPDVERVTLVDLDPRMTRLFAEHPRLTALNSGSLAHPKLHAVNADALRFLRETSARFDVAILDFPDPSNYALGKLYSREFYRVLRDRLEPSAILVTQATSPLFAPKAFWCIASTLETSGLRVLPYRIFVPSFGEWGFVLAARAPLSPPASIPIPGLAYLADAVLPTLFRFAPDEARVRARANSIVNQALVGYYVESWERFR
jgi:spermidine synthase